MPTPTQGGSHTSTAAAYQNVAPQPYVDPLGGVTDALFEGGQQLFAAEQKRLEAERAEEDRQQNIRLKEFQIEAADLSVKRGKFVAAQEKASYFNLVQQAIDAGDTRFDVYKDVLKSPESWTNFWKDSASRLKLMTDVGDRQIFRQELETVANAGQYWDKTVQFSDNTDVSDTDPDKQELDLSISSFGKINPGKRPEIIRKNGQQFFRIPAARETDKSKSDDPYFYVNVKNINEKGTGALGDYVKKFNIVGAASEYSTQFGDSSKLLVSRKGDDGHVAAAKQWFLSTYSKEEIDEMRKDLVASQTDQGYDTDNVPGLSDDEVAEAFIGQYGKQEGQEILDLTKQKLQAEINAANRKNATTTTPQSVINVRGRQLSGRPQDIIDYKRFLDGEITVEGFILKQKQKGVAGFGNFKVVDGKTYFVPEGEQFKKETAILIDVDPETGDYNSDAQKIIENVLGITQIQATDQIQYKYTTDQGGMNKTALDKIDIKDLVAKNGIGSKISALGPTFKKRFAKYLAARNGEPQQKILTEKEKVVKSKTDYYTDRFDAGKFTAEEKDAYDEYQRTKKETGSGTFNVDSLPEPPKEAPPLNEYEKVREQLKKGKFSGKDVKQKKAIKYIQDQRKKKEEIDDTVLREILGYNEDGTKIVEAKQ